METQGFRIQMEPTAMRSQARFHLKSDNSLRLWRGETATGAKVSVWCGPVVFDDPTKHIECDGILEHVKPRYPRLHWVTFGLFVAMVGTQLAINWRFAIVTAVWMTAVLFLVRVRQF